MNTEETITITKSQLIKALTTWAQDVINYPENYYDMDYETPEKYAEGAAKELILLLTKP